ncbi:MAG: Smr/MutS family protein [Proteobacteria bacterium]|nr:Smr/MutS family protein [Pseudomonadota bacterium]
MKRPLRPEEVRVWTLVARTVRPARGATLPVAQPEATPAKGKRKAEPAAAPLRAPIPALSVKPVAIPLRKGGPDVIEPGRKRRIVRERDPIDARIDLHGLNQFAAEDRLKAFLTTAQALGHRAVLVITGKGVSGEGIIRRRARDWLADQALAGVVAGVSVAHARHGGDGALYVAIKRRPDL